MASIDEDGFLSEDIDEFVRENRTKYQATFTLVSDLNKYAQSLMLRINAHDNSVQELLLAALYIRSLSTFQSVIILAEKGLETETRILIRSLMEVMFTLIACSKSKETSIRYISNDKVDSLKTIRRIKQYKGKPLLPNIEKMLLHEKELDADIKSNNIIPISIEEMSRKAGLHSHYLTVYDALSRTAHSKVKDIERNLNQLENKFIWGPKNSEIEYLLLTAAGFLIIISDNINDFFKIENSNILQDLNDKTAELMVNLGS